VAPLHVNHRNFVRAETDRMFADLAAKAGGVNRFSHEREPVSIDDQTVVRLNRDTLYSFAVVDLAEGASVTVPDAGERYLSVMVVNQDHYINRIIHTPGTYELTVDAFDTRYVLVAARILADPDDPADLAVATALQDQLTIVARSHEPFTMPEYDQASFDGVRGALKDLVRYSTDVSSAFGAKSDVDPVAHLLGAAAGWGGLPETEATYLNVDPQLPAGEYRIRVGDVPVDGFWSVSVYNADGFFEKNDLGSYSVNSITADRDDDGSVTIHLGGCGDGRTNCIPVVDGWNYLIRLYRPRPEILDGRWAFPTFDVIGD
jgi:hypothetical protein